jgi:hypothetical protein
MAAVETTCPPPDADCVVQTIDRPAPAPPVVLARYKDETHLPALMALISKDLSEPYSVFTYRYFLQGWPQLCFLVSGSTYSMPARVRLCV